MHGGTVTSQPAAASSSSSSTAAATATADFHKCECNEVFSNKNQLRIHKTSRCRLKPAVAAAVATAKTAGATATVLNDVSSSRVACKFTR